MKVSRLKPSQIVLMVYFGLCLLILFVPYKGHPNFRYSGADSSYAVWNFGFPSSSFIYDDRFGVIKGPVLWATPVLLVIIFVTFVLPPLLLMRYREAKKREALLSSLCQTCGYDLRASARDCPECGAAGRQDITSSPG